MNPQGLRRIPHGHGSQRPLSLQKRLLPLYDQIDDAHDGLPALLDAAHEEAHPLQFFLEVAHQLLVAGFLHHLQVVIVDLVILHPGII